MLPHPSLPPPHPLHCPPQHHLHRRLPHLPPPPPKPHPYRIHPTHIPLTATPPRSASLSARCFPAPTLPLRPGSLPPLPPPITRPASFCPPRAGPTPPTLNPLFLW